MEWAVVFILWAVLAGAVAAWAGRRGLTAGWYLLWALLLSPLVGFIIVAVVEPNRERQAARHGLKRCPQCAEFVQPDAKICRFCRNEFASPEAGRATGLLVDGLPQESEGPGGVGWAILFIIFVAVGLLLAVTSRI
jgi:hypothetical protein